MPILCAHCRHEIAHRDTPFFPFCSERCRLIDLDKWLSGDYVVPGADGELAKEQSDENEDPDQP